MMNEDLVKRIIQRLLAEPEFQQFFNAQAFQGVKPSCLVLLNFVPDLPELLAKLQQRWGAEYALSILPSTSIAPDEFNLPGEMKWVTPEEAFAHSDWQKIILPSCSANTLAKIALGIRDNAIAEMAACGINRGISIELYTEYLGFTPQTPQPYRRLYEGYLGKVEEYGMKVFPPVGEQQTAMAHLAPVSAKNILPGSEQGIPQTGNEKQSARIGREIIYFSKKLLADKDAFDFPNGSLVMITKTTVVSPLARDSLQSRRIELCRDTEGNQ